MSNLDLETVNKQYSQVCQEIGDAYYRIHQFEKHIEALKLKADKLNELAGILKSKESENE